MFRSVTYGFKYEYDAWATHMSEDDMDVKLDFSKAFDINGVFHTIENIQKRLLLQLNCWTVVKKPLESLCFVFHRYFTRRRFVKRCLGEANSVAAKHYFSHGVPMLLEALLEALLVHYLAA